MQSRGAQGRRRLENAEITGAGDQGPGAGDRDALLRLPWSVHSVRHKPLLETPKWSCGGAEEVSAGIQSNKTKYFSLFPNNNIRIRITGNPDLTLFYPCIFSGMFSPEEDHGPRSVTIERRLETERPSQECAGCRAEAETDLTHSGQQYHVLCLHHPPIINHSSIDPTINN